MYGDRAEDSHSCNLLRPGAEEFQCKLGAQQRGSTTFSVAEAIFARSHACLTPVQQTNQLCENYNWKWSYIDVHG